MADIAIRRACAADARQLFHLAKDFSMSFQVELTKFQAGLICLLRQDDALVLAAERDNELVAYCLAFDHLTFFANGRVTWVEEIAVKDEHRRMGIGGCLMSEVESWAGERGSRLIALATRRASAFYRAIGYDESATYFRKLLSDKI